MERNGRGFSTQRAALSARATAVLDLPLPGDNGTEGPWRQAARDVIMSSRVRPFVGPVEVTLTFRDGRRTRSFRDLPNECLQVLIGTRLIGSADSAILRRLTLGWGSVSGVRIEISPFCDGGSHGA